MVATKGLYKRIELVLCLLLVDHCLQHLELNISRDHMDDANDLTKIYLIDIDLIKSLSFSCYKLFSKF